MIAEEKPSTPPAAEPPSKIGRFIHTYTGFLSSFVIGIAGLVATSIWQYKQSEIARRQADSQQKIAETTADNQWRIERAEILSKNLQVLASRGSGSVEQRYGVLLSLTRGNILDPELAVSYALELGRDNPEYMRSVLANIPDKSYARLASAFELTCQERYGVTREVPVCKVDEKDEARSSALAGLVADDLETSHGQGGEGPLALLGDERYVQSNPARLSWLFTPYLSNLFEHRHFERIAQFEKTSPGARVIASLVLGAARSGEFVTDSEAAQIKKYHDDHSRWLADYLFSSSCTAECKGRLVDVMLTLYAESQGGFEEVLKKLVRRPRAEVGAALAKLQRRLLDCSVDNEDLAALRDAVLVPVLAEELAKPKPEPNLIDDMASLLALVPAPAEGPAKSAWAAALAKLQRAAADRYQHCFLQKRASARLARTKPSATARAMMFCNAAEISNDRVDDE